MGSIRNTLLPSERRSHTACDVDQVWEALWQPQLWVGVIVGLTDSHMYLGISTSLESTIGRSGQSGGSS